MVSAVGENRASRPVSSAKWPHHSSMLTAWSPPQLTVVAGTEAAPSSPGTMAMMSSWCRGWYTLGASMWTGISLPLIIISRWIAGHPPRSP